jgi:hypothetical protein
MTTPIEGTTRPAPLIIEQSLPRADVEIAEHRIVDASPDRTFSAARSLDFLTVRTPLLNASMWLRGLPARAKGEPEPEIASMRLSDAFDTGHMELPGWLILGEEPGKEVAFGAVGRFWKPDIEWRDVPVEQFPAFEEPGWGKIAAGFSVLPYGSHRSVLTYACRVTTTDAGSRRRFARYWRLISPFVGHIFRATLTTIARDAERATQR